MVIPIGHLARKYQVDPATVYRWWKKGIRGVRLETVMVGGRRMVPDGADERFHAAVTAASTPDAISPPRSPSASDAASKRASDQLSKRGF